MPGSSIDLADGDLALDLRWWAAANYLTVAQIYLQAQPAAARAADGRPHQAAAARALGHQPGPVADLRAAQPADPRDRAGLHLRHRSRATAARRWWPTPTSRAPTARSIPQVSADAAGLTRLVRQFSTPGGIPSHVSVQTPGSIHEGGELGYALVHAAGAAFDHPDLLVACVVGDGEAETGPLAASWKIPAFLNARRDGAVLPILQLNGYKIAGPTVLGRADDEDVLGYLLGPGLGAGVRRGRRPGRRCSRDLLSRSCAAARTRIAEIQRRPARPQPRPSPGALAGDRAAHAEGLDRPGRGRRRAGRRARSGPTRCRWPAFGRTPTTCSMLEEWLRSYRPRQPVRRRRAARARARGRWRPTATSGCRRRPYANGGLWFAAR